MHGISAVAAQPSQPFPSRDCLTVQQKSEPQAAHIVNLYNPLHHLTMPPQELILSGCSGETTASAPGRSSTAPAIHLHDLHSAQSVQPFKTSTSPAQSVSYVQTKNDMGGAVFAVQEGKAIVNIWAWQKVCTTYCVEALADFGRTRCT